MERRNLPNGYLLRVYRAPQIVHDEVHDGQAHAIAAAREHLKSGGGFAEVNRQRDMLAVWKAWVGKGGTIIEERPNREPGSDNDV